MWAGTKSKGPVDYQRRFRTGFFSTHLLRRTVAIGAKFVRWGSKIARRSTGLFDSVPQPPPSPLRNSAHNDRVDDVNRQGPMNGVARKGLVSLRVSH